MSEPVTRVFVSYSHQPLEHKERVTELARWLKGQKGIEVFFDQDQVPPKRGWPRHIDDQIQEVDVVLVVCNKTYYQRSRDSQAGGVAWEWNFIIQDLYEKGGFNDRFLPVVFSPEDLEFVPKRLRAYPHVVLTEREDYDGLLQTIRRRRDEEPDGPPESDSSSPPKWPRTALCALFDPDQTDLSKVKILLAPRRFGMEEIEEESGRLVGICGGSGGHSPITSPQRAVKSALNLRKELQRLADEPRIRIGIVTDLARIGGDFEREFEVLTQRAESLAKRANDGQILINSEVYARVQGNVSCQAVAERTWAVRGGAVPPKPSTHFVGAEHRAALQRMQEVWRKIDEAHRNRLTPDAASPGGLIVIQGALGMGKTRLLREFMDSIPPEQRTWLPIWCDPRSLESPVEGMFRDLLQIEDGTPFEDRRQRLCDMWKDRGLPPDCLEPLKSLTADLWYPRSEHDTTPKTPQERDLALEALVQMLIEEARRRPVVITVDDLNRFEDRPASRKLLSLVVRRAALQHPILVVATFRQDAKTSRPWLRHANSADIHLGPLTPDESTELLECLDPEKTIPGDVRDYIAHTTHGVPLFLSAYCKLAQAKRARSPSDLGMPTEIIEDLREMLKLLDREPAARRALQLASILGGTSFGFDKIEALWDGEDGELLAALDRLVEYDLLNADNLRGPFYFPVDALRQAAEATMDEKEKRVAHGRLAQFLEETEASYENIAYHHQHAGNLGSAVDAWQAAGLHRLSQAEPQEAIRCLKGARGLLEKREIPILLAEGQGWIVHEGFSSESALNAYQRARTLCERTGDGLRLFSSTWGLLIVHLVRGEVEASMQLATEMLEHAARDEALHKIEAICRGSIGLPQLYQGRNQAALDNIDAAIDQQFQVIPEELGLLPGAYDLHVAFLAFSSWPLWQLGRSEEAHQRAEAARDLAANALDQCLTLHVQARLGVFDDDPDRTSQIAAQLKERAAEHATTYWQSASEILLAWSCGRQALSRNDSMACRKEIKKLELTLEQRLARHELANRPVDLGNLADLYVRLGEPERGRSVLEIALDDAETRGERYWVPELKRRLEDLRSQ